MSEQPSGFGTMTIGGLDSRPYHVGVNQGEIFAALPHRRTEDGLPLSLRAYGELFSPSRLQANNLTSADVRDFVYSALASGCQVAGIELDFDYLKVGYWIDDAETDEVMKPLREMVRQLSKRIERAAERLKNGPAPTLAQAQGPTEATMIA